jgi:hypothetical protein
MLLIFLVYLTLITSIFFPHDIKARLFDIIDNRFLNKNGEKKYSYLVISNSNNGFVKYYSDSTHMDSRSEAENKKKSIGIPKKTNAIVVCWNFS